MEATTYIDIEAPLDRVAAKLLDFEGLSRWHPGLHGVSVEGSGVGAVRAYAMADQRFRERLDEIDEGRGFRYTILESPLPVTEFRASYSLAEEGSGTRVSWTGEFQVERKELELGMQLAAAALQDASLLLLKITLEQGIDLTQ